MYFKRLLKVGLKRAQPREWHRFGRSRKKSLWKGVPYERLCLKKWPKPIFGTFLPHSRNFLPLFFGNFWNFRKLPIFFRTTKSAHRKKFEWGFQLEKFQIFTTDRLLSKLLGENVILAKIGVLQFLIFLTASPSSTPPDFGAKSTGSTFCIHTASFVSGQPWVKKLRPKT